jgi:Skp family chaperone for outer membrane proteins
MNKFISGAALAALSLAVPGAALAQRTPAAIIVTVDTSRIFRDCTACKAAQTQIQAQITAYQARAQQLGQPIQTEMQSLQQAAQAAQAQPAGAARTAAENALRTRAQALQTRQDTANQELQRTEQGIQSTRQNVLRQLNERLNPIVTQVMTTHGANLALDTEATLAASSSLDVTGEVLAALNAQLPAVSVTPLPQPPAAQQPQGR